MVGKNIARRCRPRSRTPRAPWHRRDDTNIANNATVAIGTQAYDTAGFTGATSDVSGAVTYYVEKGDPTCSVTDATSLGAKTIGALGAIPDSDNYTFTSAGTYRFWADYPGDDNNDAATSACDSEIVVVGKNSPTLSTQVKDTKGTVDKGDDTNIANNATVAIGTQAYDTAGLPEPPPRDAGHGDLLRREG